MAHPVYSLSERTSFQPNAMTFHVPRKHVELAIRLLREEPVEHPEQPGAYSDPGAVCLLSLPETIRLRRIKVWFPECKMGGEGLEPASSG